MDDQLVLRERGLDRRRSRGSGTATAAVGAAAKGSAKGSAKEGLGRPDRRSAAEVAEKGGNAYSVFREADGALVPAFVSQDLYCDVCLDMVSRVPGVHGQHRRLCEWAKAGSRVEDVCLWILTHRWTEVSAAMLAATRAVDWDDVAATACADTQVLACLPGQQHSGASGGSTPPARDL